MALLNMPAQPWLRRLVSVLAAAILALVFWAYLNPHFALDVANQVWGCF